MNRFASAWPIARAAADAFRPPKRVGVAEAVSQSLRIVQPGGYTGFWSPAETPYMVEPMNLLASRLYDAVVFVGPARSGKTLALLDGWFTYAVTCDMGDMLVVQMTQDKARDYSKTRIDRAIRNSPDLKELMSLRGHDDNTHDKFFRHGMWLKIGWPSASQLASSDYRYVAITDYDRMPDSVDGEGSAFQLGRKRTTTFLSRGMCMVESSPGRDVIDPDWTQPDDAPHMAPPTKGILDLYNQGDRRRLYWQCPHDKCRQWFMPTMENFNLDVQRVFCPHCSALLEPSHKQCCNQGSRWVPEGCTLTVDGELMGKARPSRIASFWMEGPAAAYQLWDSLAQKLIKAEETFQNTGAQESLRSVVNTDWGRPYTNRVSSKKRATGGLMDRAEALERRMVPMGVRFLIATVDVQGGKHRRFVVQIHGFGEGREGWVIDRFNITEDRCGGTEDAPRQINPATNPEDWDLLTSDVLLRTYRLADGSERRMSVMAMGLDTGGEGKGEESVTSQAYDYFRRLSRQGLSDRVFLLKGASHRSDHRVRKTWPDNTGRKGRKSRAKGDVPLFLLSTDTLKDAVAGMMDRDTYGAGYMHLPAWLPRWWYEELTYEVKDPSTGKWSKPGSAANEAFDLWCYALAVYIIVGAEKINWSSPPPWAAGWDQNILVSQADSPEVTPKALAVAAKPQRRRRRVVKPRS